MARSDPDPNALACYGLLVRGGTAQKPRTEQMLLRFVDERPVSGITTPCLDGCCERLAAQGETALLLVWDNASWHVSKEVRQWMGAHNRQVKQTGTGVRMVVCPLPVKSPWLNPIEPKWMHGGGGLWNRHDCSPQRRSLSGSAPALAVSTNRTSLFTNRSPDYAVVSVANHDQ